VIIDCSVCDGHGATLDGEECPCCQGCGEVDAKCWSHPFRPATHRYGQGKRLKDYACDQCHETEKADYERDVNR
jgi:DnaJ-class molecular chaperone